MKLLLLGFFIAASSALFEVKADSALALTGHIDISGFPRINLPFGWPFPLGLPTTTTKPTTTIKATTKLVTTQKGSNTTAQSGSTKASTPYSTKARRSAPVSSTTAKLSSTKASNPSSVKTSTTLSPPSSSSEEDCPLCVAPIQNWGGNFNFSTTHVKYPTSTEAVQQLVKECKGKIRPLGTGHSFSRIADSNDTVICMTRMNLILSADPSVPSVTVQAGITYTDLVPFLQSIGMAISMMASLGEISIAGAIQTGAHGSGNGIGNLATQILGLQMVLADGSVVQYNKSSPEFPAAVLGLGALGIITQVTLQLQPTYNLAINVFEDMKISELDNNMDEIIQSGYAVNMWSTFATAGVLDEVWITSKIESNGSNSFANRSSLYGASAATAQSSPIAVLASTYVVPQMGIVGPWYERLTDYDLGLSGFQGHETQTEYYIAYKDFVPALKALQNLSSEINAIVYTALFRVTEADDLWMSPQYNKKTMGIHFSWQPKLEAVMALIPKIEALLAPFSPIPHWGKLFTLKPVQYIPLLPKYPQWREMVESHDPTRKFSNKFLENNIFAV